MKKYGFGVDIGGTTVKIGLFESDGTLLDKWEIITRKENDFCRADEKNVRGLICC